MGYNTNYQLLIISGKEDRGDDSFHKDCIRTLSGYSSLFKGEQCKWYGHEKDMILYSTKHPGVLFILIGEGEEAGDLWKKYFFNGKVQFAQAKIEYDPFDPKKLE